MAGSMAGHDAAISFRHRAFALAPSLHGDYRVWLGAIVVAGFLGGVTAVSLWRIWEILACCSGWHH
jgi:hypothetical protein